jgi:predicted peptidase
MGWPRVLLFIVCLNSSVVQGAEISFDGNVQLQIADIFIEKEYHFTGGEYHDELFKYRLFVPEASSLGERLPILIWLHGHGENGRDNLIHLRWFDRILTRREDLSDYRFFILAVQYPPENSRWFRNHGDSVPSVDKTDDMCELVREVFLELSSEYPIDGERVYLAGVSNGAAGCWEFAMRYPELFAAVVPMASPDIDSTRLHKITRVPIWVFNNSDDIISPVGPIEAAVEKLNGLGGSAYLTVCEGTKHDCWTAAFCDYDAMAWMLANRKSSPMPVEDFHSNSMLQGLASTFESWRTEDVVIQVFLICLLVWGAWQLRKLA